MKFLSSIFLAVMVFTMVSAQAFIGPVNRSTNIDYDGTIKNGSKEQHYINVINRTATAMLKGMAVVFDTTNDDGASVTLSTTAGVYPACILAQACASSASGVPVVCSCQVYGYNSAILVESTVTSITAGVKMFVSENTAGYSMAMPTASIDGNDVPLGMFYDTSGYATTASVEGFIRINK